MLEIIRRNFVELIHKYDILQAKKRAQAMAVTRRHIQAKFLKVLKTYRAYKDKKDNDELGDTVGQLPHKNIGFEFNNEDEASQNLISYKSYLFKSTFLEQLIIKHIYLL